MLIYSIIGIFFIFVMVLFYQQRKLLQEMQEQQSYHELVFEKTRSSIMLLDVQTNTVVDCNNVVPQFLNLKKSEVIGKMPPDLSPEFQPDGRKSSEKSIEMNALAIERGSHTFEWNSAIAGIGEVCCEVVLTPLIYKGRETFHVASKIIDDKKELERKNSFLAQMLEQIQDSVMAIDIEGNILSWNQGATLMLGYTEEEVIGKPVSLIYPLEEFAKKDFYFERLKNEDSFCLETHLLRKDKQTIEAETSISVLKNSLNHTIGVVAISKDIGERKKAQNVLLERKKALDYLAYHDILTKLPNRVAFNEKAERSIVFSKNQEVLGLLFIDLDRFKKINDSLGHTIGDKVLIEIAKRLNELITSTHFVFRIGGDEFTIIVENFSSKNELVKLAEEILLSLSKALYIDNHILYVSSSIGISLYPKDAKDINQLLMYADTAMYKAKDDGRNNFKFYEPKMTQLAQDELNIALDLRDAIKNEEFVVYYQAQINAKEEKIIGMEALVRWKHPTLGLIAPFKFIPIAEETGLIVEIDRLVMNIAMKQIASWYEEGLDAGVLALNLAMKQLHQKDFLTFLQETMKKHQFYPKWLELEVTEGEIMKNPEDAIVTLNKISDLGIELAIDDFGTGYSSLSYLKRLPLDKLKIDQSFVKDLNSSEEDSAIAKAVIGLAKSLNLKIIAEGVETKEQRDFLLENCCDNIQGYFYCKPIPANQMRDFLVAGYQG